MAVKNIAASVLTRLKNQSKTADLAFADALNRLEIFLEPVYSSILQKTEFDKRWNCESKQWILPES